MKLDAPGRVRHDDGVEELKVTNGDITLRVEVTGDGPTVLCVSGWPELAGETARAWRSLPAAERDDGAIVAGNYGEASALEFGASGFGKRPRHCPN